MLYNQVELIVSHIYKDKISNSFDITNLQRYFFTHTLKNALDSNTKNVNIQTIKRNTHEDVKRELKTFDIYKNNITSVDVKENCDKKYRITHKDTLFWSLYILHHGYLEYMKIHINYGNAYLNEKKKMYDNLHTKRDLVKNSNIKVTNVLFQEIMSDLMSYSNKNINYNMIYAFIAHYKFNIIILNEEKQSFFHFKNEMTGNCTHLIQLNKGKYYDISKENMDENEINTIYTTYIQLHKYDKPMKGSSSYKLDDLKAFAGKLNIDIHNLKKDHIYREIYKTIAW